MPIFIFLTRPCQIQVFLRCGFYCVIEGSVCLARAHICTRPPNIQALVQHDSRDQYVMSLATHATRLKWMSSLLLWTVTYSNSGGRKIVSLLLRLPRKITKSN